MSMTLEKRYKPKEIEEKTYHLWEESGFFAPEETTPEAIAKEDGRKRPEKFVTCIAPPNITGELHMGHALELTLQDIIVRTRRMQGYETLWIPGIDHAGIAAQNVVEKQLKKEGLARQDLGREKFEKRVEEWKEKYGNAILEQFKKLGISVDWSRIRYTRDKKYENAVFEAFKRYYDEGWIYQGVRVINWCVRCATTISDLEVTYKPEKGTLYYIKFGPFVVATVRPETRLGDTALAVNPNDKRYIEYIGKKVEIELSDPTIKRGDRPKKKIITLPVVGDEAADPEFGTGVIKVTPAHDFTDSEIAQRNGLPSIKIIGEDGKITKEGGIRYEGLSIQEARKKIIEDLKELNLIEKEEPYQHNVGRCGRCDAIIEPLPSKQWFLKVKKLARLAREAVEKQEVRLNPKRWEKPYLDWLENIHDWNISRQLWWGHRLPVWFHESKCVPRKGHEKEVGQCVEIKVSSTEPKCEHCDAKYIQSEDVLDTWFSSALWPFATLGWPDEQARDLKKYYPTNFITAGRDILYLWIMRMVYSGKYFTGDAPFHTIYIHPMVLTREGRRMSKSLGTGIDPLNLTEKYGTDALRFGLSFQTTGIQDMRFNEDVIAMGQKFGTKLWNITRFILMKTENMSDIELKPPEELDHAITAKIDAVSLVVTEQINQLNFGEAAHILYDFVWNEFANTYLEKSKNKDDEKTKDTLLYVLTTTLKLLHPFMPFLTEELYAKIPLRNKTLLIVEQWPN